MFRGTTMAGIIQDENGHNPERGFAGGYELETLSLGLPFMAAFLEPGAWGRQFASMMEGYENMAGMWIVGEDMPQSQNGVTLHASEKDDHGLPTAALAWAHDADADACELALDLRRRVGLHSGRCRGL